VVPSPTGPGAITFEALVKTIILAALTVLALAGCGTSGSASPSPNRSADPSPSATIGKAVTERDFRFDEPSLSVPVDTALAVTNAGPTIHNLAIRDASGAVLATTSDLKPGASETLPLELSAGTYEMFCSLAGHESLGLKGTITITP
jgi:plastocyanin